MMAKDAGRATSRALGRLRIAFALLSITLLGVLAIAPATSHFSEWREAQQRYGNLAQRAKLEPIDVRVRQAPSPTPDNVDRCGSCHLGAAGVAPVDGDPLFAAHPAIPHDPARFGCTICHGGQGRAVTRRAAHQGEANWEEALFPRPYREAGCGVCHSRVRLPEPELVASGRALFAVRGCGGCHDVDGHDLPTKRDLSKVGLRGFSRQWQDHHVRAAGESTDDRWAASPLPLGAEEHAAVDAFLESLVGAPQLVAGKLLVARLGCRGCHRIDGVGGDGPDLSDIGSRRPSELDFSRVRGEHSLAGWLRELLTDPSRLDPRSRMPAPGLAPAEIDQVITYLLSLRTDPISSAFWPPDRVRGMVLGERDFPTEGRPLFQAFCSACHGPRGIGRAPAGAVAFAPAIGGDAFLAIASDGFLRETVRQGRPEHMPAWGASDGGLHPEEIDAIASYLRTLQHALPSFAEVSASVLDLARGREVFQQTCTPCHGARGEGTAIGPPLAAADNPVTVREEAIYGTLARGVDDTAMGSFRTFDAPTLRALIGAVTTLDRTDGPRKDWRPRAGDPGRGRELFGRHCVTCHGARPEGRKAPAIEDPRFVATAPDSFLTASIVRRHDRSREELRRSPDEVADLVAYLRSLGPAPASAGDR
ncbi:MAG TPA: c-type cytochrome [Polyangiaceae bacterium]|nr:c-type cytochrome [Polyangiaceae bacterium]